jgi:hypothetical protein
MNVGRKSITNHENLDKVLRNVSPRFYHIQVAKVQVVDHLGQPIFIPSLFCSTWKVCINETHALTR